MITNLSTPKELGSTGMYCGRMGISSSFKAPSKAFVAAFEAGCTYFTLGTILRGNSKALTQAMQQLFSNGNREKIHLALLSYSHMAWSMQRGLHNRLKKLGTTYADILILGYFNKRPPQRLLNAALELKRQGKIKAIGLTSHNRKLIRELAHEGVIDVFHIRYNAANRGAEEDVFPHLPTAHKPGIVSFTATRWRSLLKSDKLPDWLTPASAIDCYRFVLTNPSVDVCMMGAKSYAEMMENLQVLNKGTMQPVEMERMRDIGDYVYGRKKKEHAG